MYAAYLTATLLAATLTASAAVANFIGHSCPKSEADRLQIPHSCMRPFVPCWPQALSDSWPASSWRSE